MAEMIKEPKNSIYNTVTKNRSVLWRQTGKSFSTYWLSSVSRVSIK